MNIFENIWTRIGIALLLVVAGAIAFTFEAPPVDSAQRGFRGTGMVQVENANALAAQIASQQAPKPIPSVATGGPPASQIYKNVKVLKDLNVAQFTRIMTAMSSWIAPEQGCTYCHTANFASDKKYTKVVARRMLRMTRHINSNWQRHVGKTGVTCYTCHRGRPVPSEIWFRNPDIEQAQGLDRGRAGQNAPAAVAGFASLPYDAFSEYLVGGDEVRVVSTEALPVGKGPSIKQAEHTYALMMHMSQSLGVNCTFCHNSRSFMGWGQSTPQRSTAYFGIRLARELNNEYLRPLTGEFPPERLGPLGDGPKLNCATCHQGVYKPLFGAKMLKDYPELRAAAEQTMRAAPAQMKKGGSAQARGQEPAAQKGSAKSERSMR